MVEPKGSYSAHTHNREGGCPGGCPFNGAALASHGTRQHVPLASVSLLEVHVAFQIHNGIEANKASTNDKNSFESRFTARENLPERIHVDV